jgi:hypothetical protein
MAMAVDDAIRTRALHGWGRGRALGQLSADQSSIGGTRSAHGMASSSSAAN